MSLLHVVAVKIAVRNEIKRIVFLRVGCFLQSLVKQLFGLLLLIADKQDIAMQHISLGGFERNEVLYLLDVAECIVELSERCIDEADITANVDSVG